LIWSTKRGITEPLEAITLPYRVPQNTIPVPIKFRDLATITFSLNAFIAPDITNVIPDFCVVIILSHIILPFFIATENANFFNIGL
jgi:hypothetical protein